MRTDNASWSFFRQRIVEFSTDRSDSASWRLLTVRSSLPAVPSLRALPTPSTTSPAGNRQRPLRGGHHDRRTHGAATAHQSPPRRPIRQVHLHGSGPRRGLVPQVVGPLPADRPRRPLRPHTGQPPRRPAALAPVGEGHPLRPPP